MPPVVHDPQPDLLRAADARDACGHPRRDARAARGASSRSLGILICVSVAAACTIVRSGNATLKDDAVEEPNGTAGVPGDGGANTPDPADQTILSYAEECKAELGITQPLPALNCLAGAEIPIVTDGTPLTSETWDAFKQNGSRCDAPHWLGNEEGCFPYDHIQKVDVGNPDVVAILNCRQKYFTPHENNGAKAPARAAYAAAVIADPAKSDNAKRRAFEFYASFNDMGFVLRSKSTGKTCFFTDYDRKFYGGYVPPPDQAAPADPEAVYAALPAPKPPRPLFDATYFAPSASERWKTPDFTAQAGCVRCHDGGGWKHSPFVDQMNLVPRNGAKPYLPVGALFQAEMRQIGLREVNTKPINGEDQVCTSCHRIAARGSTCERYIDLAVGNYDRTILDLVSPTAAALPRRSWMPAGHEATTEAAFTTQYQGHVEALKCCCNDPTAKGCFSRGYGPTAAEVETAWSEGLGPETCVP